MKVSTGGTPASKAGVLERWRAPITAQGGRPSERFGDSRSGVGGGDGEEIGGLQARAADQRAVDIVEAEELVARCGFTEPP